MCVIDLYILKCDCHTRAMFEFYDFNMKLCYKSQAILILKYIKYEIAEAEIVLQTNIEDMEEGENEDIPKYTLQNFK